MNEAAQVRNIEALAYVVTTLCEMLKCDVTYLISNVEKLQGDNKQIMRQYMESSKFINGVKAILLPPEHQFTDEMLLQLIQSTANDKQMMKERALEAEYKLSEVETMIATVQKYLAE